MVTEYSRYFTIYSTGQKSGRGLRRIVKIINMRMVLYIDCISCFMVYKITRHSPFGNIKINVVVFF